MYKYAIWGHGQYGSSNAQTRPPNLLQVLQGLERIVAGADPGDRVYLDCQGL